MKKILLLSFFLVAGMVSGYGQVRYHYYSEPRSDRYFNDYDNYRSYSRYGDYTRQRYSKNSYERRENPCHGNSYYGDERAYRSRPISDENFRTFLNYISGLHFDESRLTQAKQAIRNNTLTSAQVKSLMDELTFDANKLELAKYSFPYTYDKGMYFLVNESFTFNSSGDELEEYLSSMGY